MSLLLGLILGFIFGGTVYHSLKQALDNDLNFYDFKYKPVFTGHILPIALLFGFFFHIGLQGQKGFLLFISYCVNFIVIITIYYVILFMLLKGFRKYFHPLSVSTLWMLPNMLYFFVIHRRELWADYAIILDISPIVLSVILILWFVISVSIITYKVHEHFSYRKMILQDAIEITDQHIIKLFNHEISKIEFKIKELKLMQSNALLSPITIGVRHKVVVLPHVNYTDEEFELIFKHEMIHIARTDVMTKIYFVFCNAFCWFNPLMWIANKKCSEDLELSCDTSVLVHKGEDIRKQYAHLILNNSCSEKGFTSCLSANAKSLQYRLKNIIHPTYKSNGGFIIILLTMLLVLGWGRIGIAIKGFDGYEHIFDSKEVVLEEIYPVNVEFQNRIYNYEYQDKIIEYISNLELSQLPELILKESESKSYIQLNFRKDSEMIRVSLYDHFVSVMDESYKFDYFYVKDGIDFEYLNQIIDSYPSIKLEMMLGEDMLGYLYWPSLSQVSEDGKVIYRSKDENDYSNMDETYDPNYFKMVFYDELLEDVEVIEETSDGIQTYLIDKDELPLVTVPQKDVHYTIKAKCKINNHVYDATFAFDLKENY